MTLARANSWRIGKPTLLSSLAKVRLGSVVSIVAPAGYGKTTALQAWQENADLRAIGVRLGPEHNDEVALALHLIDALGGLVPTVRDVMEGGRPGDADWGRALLRSLSQTYLVLRACPTIGVNGTFHGSCCYRVSGVGMRSAKVTANALRAGFQRVTHRACPVPFGSSDLTTR